MSLKLDRCEVECAGQGDPVRLAAAIHRQMPDAAGPVPVEDVALALDILSITEQPFAGIEAVLQTDAVKSFGAIGVKAGTRSTRRRYSIGHELGHFLNERHKPTAHGMFTCAASDLCNPFGEQRHVRQEREANIFAIELLTPRVRLGPILKRSADMERAMTIAERFEVSREAALRRYVDLHQEKLAVVFSKGERVIYAHRPDGFPRLMPGAGDAVGETPGAASASERITSLDEVDAESWLRDYDGWTLFAQTLFQSDRYTATLLLAERRDDEDRDEPRFR